MKFKYVLILLLPVFMIIGCDDDSSITAAVDPCIALQVDMDTNGAALMAEAATGAMDATTCAATLAAVTALKDNSCNASTIMMDGDPETWVVDAEDVAEVQEMCDAIDGN